MDGGERDAYDADAGGEEDGDGDAKGDAPDAQRDGEGGGSLDGACCGDRTCYSWLWSFQKVLVGIQ